MSARGETVTHRFYRRLLGLYPPAFRRAHGDDLLDVFSDAWLEARSRRGALGRGAFLAGMAGDVLLSALAAWMGAAGERRRQRAGSPPAPYRPRRSRPGPGRLLADATQDAWGALRGFRQRPGFTALALATIALGIGAVTAIFSVLHAVLLAPLPYRDAERLVGVWNNNRDPVTGNGSAYFAVNPAQFHAWSEDSRTLEEVAAFATPFGPVGREGELAVAVAYGSVSWNFFRFLGVEPALGRLFTADDDPTGPQAEVAVLSHAYWTQSYGGDPAALGTTLLVAGAPHTIVGVLPRGFRWIARRPGFPLDDEPVAWVPRYMPREESNLAGQSLVGRLRPGARVEEVAAELGRWRQARQEAAGRPPRASPADYVTVLPYRDWLVGDVRAGILLLVGAVSCLLLLACINVANLLLARALGRGQEMALRSSLGASRGRLTRQLLTEALVLSLAGCALGLPLAMAGVRLLRALGPEDIPRLDQASVDPVALGVSLGLSLLCGLLFGALPALRASRPDLSLALAEGGKGRSAGRATNPLMDALVVGQLALAMVVVAGAGLMLRSFWNLVSEDLGLDAKGVWVAQVTIPATAPYMEDTGIPVQQTTRNWIVRTGEHFQAPVRLVERLRVDPRVSAAAVAQGAPLTGGAPERNVVRRVGAPPLPEDEPTAFANWVEPGWFELMGMERVAGRLFGEADTRRGTPRVAVVSRSVAERYWPAGDAVGGRFLWHRFQRGAGQFDMTEEPVEIVGVVESIQDVQIGFPGMEYGRGPTLSVYFLRSQTEDTVPAFNRLGSFRLFVRPRGDAPVRDAVLDALAAEAPDLTLLGVRPLTEVTGRWVRTPRFYAFLLAVFGGASALLVAVGIAGVMAMAVTHRTREIGIRVALGATRAAVLRLVLRGTLALALLGLALGTGGALFLARFLASQLHELGPNDPLTLAAAVAFMLSVSLLAAWLPARSVTGIDPARVLRAD